MNYSPSVYKFKPDFRLPDSLDPQAVGEEIERLRKQTAEGEVLRQKIVEAARPKNSPLHDAFEWDDTAAAEKYRLEQASYLIRAIDVYIDNSGQGAPVRAIISVRPVDRDPKYVNTRKALKNKDERKLIVDRAYTELLSWCVRYENMQLKEFNTLFAAIRKFPKP